HLAFCLVGGSLPLAERLEVRPCHEHPRMHTIELRLELHRMRQQIGKGWDRVSFRLLTCGRLNRERKHRHDSGKSSRCHVNRTAPTGSMRPANSSTDAKPKGPST